MQKLWIKLLNVLSAFGQVLAVFLTAKQLGFILVVLVTLVAATMVYLFAMDLPIKATGVVP